jgi:hypothetical protein
MYEAICQSLREISESLVEALDKGKIFGYIVLYGNNVT